MSKGRPSMWDKGAGTAPPVIGVEPAKHDADGLFLREHKEKEDWDNFLSQHTVGTTERKWDKKMLGDLKGRVKHYLKLTASRTACATEVYCLGKDVDSQKRFVKHSSDAFTQWLDEHDGKYSKHMVVAHTTPAPTSPEDFMDMLADNIVRAVGEASPEDSTLFHLPTDAWATALKEKCRVVASIAKARELAGEVKAKQLEFKRLAYDVKLIHDDITYLIEQMREAGGAYEDATASQALDDDPYELPDPDKVLLGLPSHNRLKRSDGTTATTDGTDTTDTTGASVSGSGSDLASGIDETIGPLREGSPDYRPLLPRAMPPMMGDEAEDKTIGPPKSFGGFTRWREKASDDGDEAGDDPRSPKRARTGGGE